MTRDEALTLIRSTGKTLREFQEFARIGKSSVYMWGRPRQPVPPWVPVMVDLINENRALRAEIHALRNKIESASTL